jgi:threonine synthase
VGQVGQVGQVGRVGIFLATAHPAKFREIVEPVIGRTIDTPAPLAQALAQPRHILRLPAAGGAVQEALLSAQ